MSHFYVQVAQSQDEGGLEVGEAPLRMGKFVCVCCR